MIKNIYILLLLALSFGTVYGALLKLTLTYSFNHSVSPDDSISLTYQGETINYPENGGISYTDNGDGTATLINIILEVDSDPADYNFLIELRPAEFPDETITGVVMSTGVWESPPFAALPWVLTENIQVEFNYTPEYILGDINGDGTINVIDIVIAVDLILNNNYDVVGDVNADEQLNVLDIVMLVDWVLNGESSICDGLIEVELWGETYDIGTTTEIWLQSQGLSGSIPPEIGCLTNLTILHLLENQLTDSIPPEIGNLTNLYSLQLQENQLTGEIPPEIGSLTNLTNLWLHNNQLTGSIPPEIGNLTNLVYLGLYNNQLTGEIPSSIGNLTNLTYLWLWTNQLTGEIPSEIGNLTNLTYLDLFSNQLTGEIPSTIGNLTNLTDLWLSENQLTGEIPSTIGNLTNLTNLGLYYNQLTGEIPQEVCDLIESNNIPMNWILNGNNLINTCE